MTSHAPQRPISARGFTAIELVVVIAVTAPLVAVFLAAGGSAREKALRVSSRAQLHAIGSACEVYQTVFNAYPGYLPDQHFDQNHAGFTANENLVLSLLGRTAHEGGWTVPGSDPQVSVDLDRVGDGPRTIQGRTFGAFYAPRPDELAKVNKSQYAPENAMPELINVAWGAPLLYYRPSRNRNRPVGTNADDQARFTLSPNFDFTNGERLAIDKPMSQNKSLINTLAVALNAARRNQTGRYKKPASSGMMVLFTAPSAGGRHGFCRTILRRV